MIKMEDHLMRRKLASNERKDLGAQKGKETNNR